MGGIGAAKLGHPPGPGVKQALENWYTPPALNEGAWKVLDRSNDRAVRMTTHMKLQNASATPFHLAATRDVRLLTRADLAKLFGEASAAAPIDREGLTATAEKLRNIGVEWSTFDAASPNGVREFAGTNFGLGNELTAGTLSGTATLAASAGVARSCGHVEAVRAPFSSRACVSATE